MIKFYFNLAPNPTKVALCLEEMGLTYEIVPVDTRKGEQHTPAFLAINPNAKVPAIVDDDVTVFDSNAILLYLAEKTGPVPAGELAQGARRDAVVADVRGLGHRTLFGPGGAFPALRARAQATTPSTATRSRPSATGASSTTRLGKHRYMWATPTPSSTWRCGAGRG